MCELTDVKLSSVTKVTGKPTVKQCQCEETCYKRDGIISDVIDGIIILNPNEEASSGDKRMWWSSGDMNSDF
jgi:hypothetical protein